jgi:hypothetical protein
MRALAALLSVLAVASAGAARADVAALLFAKGAGSLTKAEQAAIAKQLDVKVAPDGKSFVDTVCGEPAAADVELSDMNGDGASEALVTYGNSCLSGMAGSTVVLFVKKPGGAYAANLGFPGVIAERRPPGHQGYADLLIGGPGFCFPLWRWNGSEYAPLKNEPQEPGGCDGR